jgi:hypothetical protein
MTKYYLLYKNSLGFNLAKFLEREQAESTAKIWLETKKVSYAKVVSEKILLEVLEK